MSDETVEAVARVIAGPAQCCCDDDWRQPRSRVCPVHGEGSWPYQHHYAKARAALASLIPVAEKAGDRHMSDTRLEDTLTFTDWNALRVLVDDHTDAALARVLIAEKRGLPSNGAQVAYVQAERLQKKVYAAFCSAGSDGEDR